MDDNKSKLVVFGSIALVAGGVVTATILGNLINFDSNPKSSADSNNSDQSSQINDSASNDPQSTVAKSGVYKDGTFSATGTYFTQRTTEHLVVSITLKDAIVTDVNVQGDPQSNDTVLYQDLFEKNYKTLVVGKNLDFVKVSRVSGSSLTSGGFMDAISKIKNDAKVTSSTTPSSS